MKTITTRRKAPVKKEEEENSFPVVAIGASAGGLEAMMELLLHLPADTGMAFIYVQHLSPDHKSLLTEILSKKTKMKVQEIDDMDKIKPDNVFIIPYNKGIEVTDGHIKLIPRSQGSTAVSIDVLFSSLAEAQKDRVIGIVLSGSASDGTVGIKAIKHEGGLTFAQDDSAKFSSMPHSAIAAGVVDFVLSPKEIALELERLSKHPFTKQAINGDSAYREDVILASDPELLKVFGKLRESTGVDFSAYKLNTIKRRITRRMFLYKITTLKQYVELLNEKNEEIAILYQDLLINVTSFFRDTDAHKYLKETLLPNILKRKQPGESVRIWVPACATGEEAYSIAMMLMEIQGDQTTGIPVQIFATDLSEHAVGKARSGIYSSKDLESVSPRRIQRFFTNDGGNYRVNKAIRNLCVFAPHNVLSDPPFSRLDFISCCNLFIYFDTTAQRNAVKTFHYALNADGFLMLGKSENISHSSNLFTELNKKFKVFSRNHTGAPALLPKLLPRLAPEKTSNRYPLLKKWKDRNPASLAGNEMEAAMDALLVAEFIPASVIINHQFEIMQFRGNTERFLTNPNGRATLNIIKKARPEIASELRIGIAKVIKSKQRYLKNQIEVDINSHTSMVSVEILPMVTEPSADLLLIVFREDKTPKPILSKKNGTGLASPLENKISKLERELASARAEAIEITEEHEEFTQELQSANEEVVSSNEELQTVNEELETSKEELESANEELTTSNQELQIRNDLLNESYEYSEAIISTIHEPMLVLGKDLRVKSANKAFYGKFKFAKEDIEGVLLYDLGNKEWNIPALKHLLEDIVTKDSDFYGFEVSQTFPQLGEKIMSLNARRIVQKAHRENLILLGISDITEVRQLLSEKDAMEKARLSKEITERAKEKERLEKAVAERTLELEEANSLLEKKNSALQSMNKELEAFTYVSSHDLQEPLRKIQMYSSRILDNEVEKLTAKGKNHLQLIGEAAARMQSLIRDLLSFSRVSVDARKFEIVNPAIIIKDVLNELKELIEEKKALVVVRKTCEIKAIPFLFRQLMYNLISNALKFSNPAVRPRITISSENKTCTNPKNPKLPQSNEYCHITVSDNGIGFEKEFSEKIFELFQKLHGKDKYAGTGIGLAIVKKIVDNHNGFISATGELNKGAKFDIYIPLP